MMREDGEEAGVDIVTDDQSVSGRRAGRVLDRGLSHRFAPPS